MASKNKLVENVDDDTWRRFSGHCKMNNVLTGRKLSEVLNIYLDGKNKR